jgi:hypothetical protein
VYGGLVLCEVRRLKQLEEENIRLRKLVADLTLDKEMLTEVIKKRSDGDTEQRDDRLRQNRLPGRNPTGVPCGPRAYHYRSVRPPQDVLRKRIRELAETHAR